MRIVRLTAAMTALLPVAMACGAATRPAAARSDDNATSPDARVETYRQVDDVNLRLFIFDPPDHRAEDRRPAIVFFFGGGWKSGNPAQFFEQCRYFASRGMVAASAEYRVHSRHGAMVADCVADAQAAIRWVRRNARRLGIDPDRIAAGGGSAGGHLAAACATLRDFTGQADEAGIRPNALVLFNPALDLVRDRPAGSVNPDRLGALYDRLGAEPRDLSPFRHVVAGLPPTIIFHGTKDALISYASIEAFVRAMTGAGNRCELSGFPGQGHGFFNHRPRGNPNFTATLAQADAFLASLGYLKGPPTLRPTAPATRPADGRE